jgi:fatty acid desaturase
VRSCPASFYVHHLKPRLSTAVWKPAPSRLLWFPVHVSVIAVATVAIARGWLPWPAFPVLSLIIGFAFSGLLFVGHEVMHGGMVRGRRLRLFIGGLCFAPVVVSPHLWAAWHNRVHHANANRLDVDPDMYPSLARYRSHRAARFAIDHFALGGRRWRGLLSVFFGFTVRCRARRSWRRHARVYTCLRAITGTCSWRHSPRPRGGSFSRA